MKTKIATLLTIIAVVSISLTSCVSSQNGTASSKKAKTEASKKQKASTYSSSDAQKSIDSMRVIQAKVLAKELAKADSLDRAAEALKKESRIIKKKAAKNDSDDSKTSTAEKKKEEKEKKETNPNGHSSFYCCLHHCHAYAYDCQPTWSYSNAFCNPYYYGYQQQPNYPSTSNSFVSISFNPFRPFHPFTITFGSYSDPYAGGNYWNNNNGTYGHNYGNGLQFGYDQYGNPVTWNGHHSMEPGNTNPNGGRNMEEGAIRNNDLSNQIVKTKSPEEVVAKVEKVEERKPATQPVPVSKPAPAPVETPTSDIVVRDIPAQTGLNLNIVNKEGKSEAYVMPTTEAKPVQQEQMQVNQNSTNFNSSNGGAAKENGFVGNSNQNQFQQQSQQMSMDEASAKYEQAQNIQRGGNGNYLQNNNNQKPSNAGNDVAVQNQNQRPNNNDFQQRPAGKNNPVSFANQNNYISPKENNYQTQKAVPPTKPVQAYYQAPAAKQAPMPSMGNAGGGRIGMGKK